MGVGFRVLLGWRMLGWLQPGKARLRYRNDEPMTTFYISIHKAAVLRSASPLRVSRFCLVPYGWGWGIRIVIAVENGCIPVIIQVGAKGGGYVWRCGWVTGWVGT